MKKWKRNVLILTGLYILFILGAWFWFDPNFVSERVHGRIAIGAQEPDVESQFQVRQYIFPNSSYCGKDGPPNISRIAIDETGRIPLFPFPKEMVTTTIFCFDENEKLVGMRTERWFDEL